MTVKAHEDRLIAVGVVLGAHGVRGAVKIKSFTEAPEDCLAYGPLLDEAGGVLFEPKAAAPARNHLIVTPKFLRQKEELDGMKGRLVFVPRDAMPGLDDEDDFYIEDLVGLTVLDTRGAPHGSVKAVHDFGAGDIIEIVNGENTIMVPFTSEDVPHVDLEAGHIHIATLSLWTEGED